MGRFKLGTRKRKVLVIYLYITLLVTILLLSLLGVLTQTALAETQEADGSDTYAASRESITVKYRGRTLQTTARAETVGELLSRLGLEVTAEDMVFPGMEEQTREGMEIQVDHVVTVRQSHTAAVPHQVSLCHDPSLPRGAEQVLTEGEDGEVLRTADVTYRNGLEIKRENSSETMTKAPVTEIVSVGTGAAEEKDGMPVIGDGFILLPTGERLTYTHTGTVRATAYTHTDEGCDFTTSTGTKVRWGTVAVDPRYIPYGTRMFIMASSGSYVYGIAVAEDCGGAIKGDRMDLYMPTYQQCIEFGRRVCTIYYLG